MAKEIRRDGRKASRKHKFEVVVMFKHGRNLCHRSFIVWAYMLHDAVTELELFDDDVKELERAGWKIHAVDVSRTPVLVRKDPNRVIRAIDIRWSDGRKQLIQVANPLPCFDYPDI